MSGDIDQGPIAPRLEICRYQQYLSITSRFDDVLPAAPPRRSISSGIKKRALPSRVERPFRFSHHGRFSSAMRFKEQTLWESMPFYLVTQTSLIEAADEETAARVVVDKIRSGNKVAVTVKADETTLSRIVVLQSQISHRQIRLLILMLTGRFRPLLLPHCPSSRLIVRRR